MRWMVEKTRWIECGCCQNANTCESHEWMKAQQAHKAGVHVVCVDEAQCGTVKRGNDGMDVMDKHKVAPHTCTHGKQPWLCALRRQVLGTHNHCAARGTWFASKNRTS